MFLFLMPTNYNLYLNFSPAGNPLADIHEIMKLNLKFIYNLDFFDVDRIDPTTIVWMGFMRHTVFGNIPISVTIQVNPLQFNSLDLRGVVNKLSEFSWQKYGNFDTFVTDTCYEPDFHFQLKIITRGKIN